MTEQEKSSSSPTSSPLTKIPLISRVLLFASTSVTCPLHFAAVTSTWEEAVYDFSSSNVERIWRKEETTLRRDKPKFSSLTKLRRSRAQRRSLHVDPTVDNNNTTNEEELQSKTTASELDQLDEEEENENSSSEGSPIVPGLSPGINADGNDSSTDGQHHHHANCTNEQRRAVLLLLKHACSYATLLRLVDLMYRVKVVSIYSSFDPSHSNSSSHSTPHAQSLEYLAIQPLTPLTVAASNGLTATCKLLIEKFNTNPMQQASASNTSKALHYACQSGNLECVEFLFAETKKGYEEMYKNKALTQSSFFEGNFINGHVPLGTALTRAIASKAVSVVEFLLKRKDKGGCGASPIWPNSDRWSPMDVAVLFEDSADFDVSLDMVKLLHKAGAPLCHSQMEESAAAASAHANGENKKKKKNKKSKFTEEPEKKKKKVKRVVTMKKIMKKKNSSPTNSNQQQHTTTSPAAAPVVKNPEEVGEADEDIVLPSPQNEQQQNTSLENNNNNSNNNNSNSSGNNTNNTNNTSITTPDVEAVENLSSIDSADAVKERQAILDELNAEDDEEESFYYEEEVHEEEEEEEDTDGVVVQVDENDGDSNSSGSDEEDLEENDTDDDDTNSNNTNDDHLIQMHLTPEESMSPLLLASEVGNVKLIDWLLQSGADPTAKNGMGQTCLHICNLRRHDDCVKYLVRSGCVDIHAKDFSGDDAFSAARKRQHLEMVNHFKDHTFGAVQQMQQLQQQQQQAQNMMNQQLQNNDGSLSNEGFRIGREHLNDLNNNNNTNDDDDDDDEDGTSNNRGYYLYSRGNNGDDSDDDDEDHDLPVGLRGKHNNNSSAVNGVDEDDL